MVEHLYNNDSWGLNPPRLILSIVGGYKNFLISHKIKRAFKNGLIKAAASTSAWIITDGTNSGVMKLVGEAVSDERQKYNSQITLLGITTWVYIQIYFIFNLLNHYYYYIYYIKIFQGKIAMREEMIVNIASTKKYIKTYVIF